MAEHCFIKEYSRCKNYPHLKWAHEDPGLMMVTCENFEFQDNLQYLEYKVWKKEKCDKSKVWRLFNFGK